MALWQGDNAAFSTERERIDQALWRVIIDTACHGPGHLEKSLPALVWEMEAIIAPLSITGNPPASARIEVKPMDLKRARLQAQRTRDVAIRTLKEVYETGITVKKVPGLHEVLESRLLEEAKNPQ